ncbi:MAG TPA: hypothetical protein VFC32_10865 [Pseudolabrys sp.]|nr:hypothetical protein [Pseudolabrys sp.]
MTRIAISLALVVALVTTAPAQAADVMNESQARAAAVKILKGDPYGQTPAEVMKNMQDAQLITAGSVCNSKVTKPVWRLHVVVPKDRNPSGDSEIDGYLVIDGQTGKIVCAGLPFLN